MSIQNTFLSLNKNRLCTSSLYVSRFTYSIPRKLSGHYEEMHFYLFAHAGGVVGAKILWNYWLSWHRSTCNITFVQKYVNFTLWKIVFSVFIPRKSYWVSIQLSDILFLFQYLQSWAWNFSHFNQDSKVVPFKVQKAKISQILRLRETVRTL